MGSGFSRPPPFVYCCVILVMSSFYVSPGLGFTAPWISRPKPSCRLQSGRIRLKPNLRTPDLGSILRRAAPDGCMDREENREIDGGQVVFEKNDSGESASESKTLSPLAMAAADWLDEEEDELSKYWGKFDDAKQGDAAKRGTMSLPSNAIEDTPVTSNKTTEELLDSYYKSRGIDKASEREYQGEIESAVKAARSAASAEEAVMILERVRPYLQQNTNLGGNTLLELAECYEAKDETGKADEIYAALRSNPQTAIRQRVKQILLNPASRPRRKFQTGLWEFLRWEKWK